MNNTNHKNKFPLLDEGFSEIHHIQDEYESSFFETSTTDFFFFLQFDCF